MTAPMIKKMIPMFFIFVFILFVPHILFAFDPGDVKIDFKKKTKDEAPVEIKVVADLQDRYNNLNASLPAMVMLNSTGTSIVPSELLLQIDSELSKQLVNDGKIKPVSMQKWLSATYYTQKAQNPFAFMNTVHAEQYVVPLQFICKPSISKSEHYYIININFYSLKDNHYPVSVLRLFETAEDIPLVLTSCLNEMYLRLFEQNRGANKKRIVIQNFRLDFLKFVALDSGEFEFIPAPFISQHGVTLREGDDYFSLLLGYILSTTNLFQVLRPADFAPYANSSGMGTADADYSIQGRIQLSEELTVLYVDVRDIRTNTILTTIKYPFKDCTLSHIWNVYREISVKIISTILPASSYGIVPNVSAKERGFYANNMFIGWNTLEHVILPKGMHQVLTGSYINPGSVKTGFERVMDGEALPKQQKAGNAVPDEKQVKKFFVFLDTIDQVFYDREGEYVWNLLKK